MSHALFFLGLPAMLLASCATPFAPLPEAPATRETAAVGSPADAADDPAIWIDAAAPERSIILGTDKQAGLYAYTLEGSVTQFLPVGALNNIDLRQGVAAGAFSGDIAAASNRSDNTITLFVIENGKLRKSGAFASTIVEPYGLCMGNSAGAVMVFVAYKTGDLIAYRLTGEGTGVEAARLKLATQLEGCVFDDEAGTLYIGEEGRGVWKASFANELFGAPALVDEVGGVSGITADIEGMALYKIGPASGYLIVSSQGDYSYAVYDRSGDNRFLGRFRIGPAGAVDGAEETDGLEATPVALGADFPAGALIVQDGFNLPKGQKQNFKIVDWRSIETVINPLN